MSILKKLRDLAHSGGLKSALITRRDLAAIIRKQEREAREHGNERRRYMGNNRALMARIEHLEACQAEMGEVIDDLNAELVEARRERLDAVGRAAFSESARGIILRALGVVE